MRDELRDLLPAWAVMVLLPVPMTTFWTEGAGRLFVYSYLFVGAAILTAESFGRTRERLPRIFHGLWPGGMARRLKAW